MNLSDHFKLYEVVRSQTAARLGIDNTPPEELMQKLVFLCENILEPIRKFAGRPITPNSVFRCLELNRAIGSKDSSQHVAAEAADIEIPGISNFDLASWCSLNLVFDQLILEFYTPGDPNSGWVHISRKLDEAENRGQVLTIGRDGVQQGLVF